MLDEAEDLPRVNIAAEDSIEQVASHVVRLVLKHPIAAQAIFSAFVAEGRRFARTPEGRRWRAALADSEFVRRGRALWEGSLLNWLEDNPETLIPTAVLDAIVQVISQGDASSALAGGPPGTTDADDS
jgi:hypothetical protein